MTRKRSYWDGDAAVTLAGVFVGTVFFLALLAASVALTWMELDSKGSPTAPMATPSALADLDPAPLARVGVLQVDDFGCDTNPQCTSTGTWRFIDTVRFGQDTSKSYEFLVNLREVNGSISGSAVPFQITGSRVGTAVHLDFVGPSSAGHFELRLTGAELMVGTFEDTRAKNGGSTGAFREGAFGQQVPRNGTAAALPNRAVGAVAGQEDAIRLWLGAGTSQRYIGECPRVDSQHRDTSLDLKICSSRLNPTPEGWPVFTLTYFSGEPGGPLLLLQIDGRGVWVVADHSRRCTDGVSEYSGLRCDIPSWAEPYQFHRALAPTPSASRPGTNLPGTVPTVIATATVRAVGSAGGSSSAATSYRVIEGQSLAWYLAPEKLASLPTSSVAKGTTNDVRGQFNLTAEGLDSSKPTTFTVGLKALKSNERRRDDRAQTALETAKFPSATFTAESLTGMPKEFTANDSVMQLAGTLDLHGVTRDVTWDLRVRKEGNILSGLGTLRLRYDAFGIKKPDVLGFVSVDEELTLQVQLFAVATTVSPPQASAVSQPTAPASARIQVPVTTATGLQYEDVVVGGGSIPQTGHLITIDYVMTLEDGTRVDSTYVRGETFTFTFGVNSLIQGFEEGIGGMREGGRRLLRIPPTLGYGSGSSGSGIPSNAVLLADVTLRSAQ